MHMLLLLLTKIFSLEIK